MLFLENIAAELKSQLPAINLITHPIPRLAEPQPASSDSLPSGLTESCSPFMKRIPADVPVFYVGGESLALNNLLLTHSTNQVGHSLALSPAMPACLVFGRIGVVA